MGQKLELELAEVGEQGAGWQDRALTLQDLGFSSDQWRQALSSSAGHSAAVGE